MLAAEPNPPQSPNVRENEPGQSPKGRENLRYRDPGTRRKAAQRRWSIVSEDVLKNAIAIALKAAESKTAPPADHAALELTGVGDAPVDAAPDVVQRRQGEALPEVEWTDTEKMAERPLILFREPSKEKSHRSSAVLDGVNVADIGRKQRRKNETHAGSSSPAKVQIVDPAALSKAAKVGDVATGLKLLQSGDYDVNFADATGATALIHCVWDGHFDFIQLLVSFGANVNAKTNRKNSALHFAFEREWEDIVEFLLREGASPDLKNTLGKRPSDLRPYHMIHNPSPPPTPRNDADMESAEVREQQLKRVNVLGCLAQLTAVARGGKKSKSAKARSMISNTPNHLRETAGLGETLGHTRLEDLSVRDIGFMAAKKFSANKAMKLQRVQRRAAKEARRTARSAGAGGAESTPLSHRQGSNGSLVGQIPLTRWGGRIREGDIPPPPIAIPSSEGGDGPAVIEPLSLSLSLSIGSRTSRGPASLSPASKARKSIANSMWKEWVDDKKRTFFFNSKTGQKMWHAPEGFVTNQMKQHLDLEKNGFVNLKKVLIAPFASGRPWHAWFAASMIEGGLEEVEQWVVTLVYDMLLAKCHAEVDDVGQCNTFDSTSIEEFKIEKKARVIEQQEALVMRCSAIVAFFAAESQHRDMVKRHASSWKRDAMQRNKMAFAQLHRRVPMPRESQFEYGIRPLSERFASILNDVAGLQMLCAETESAVLAIGGFLLNAEIIQAKAMASELAVQIYGSVLFQDAARTLGSQDFNVGTPPNPMFVACTNRKLTIAAQELSGEMPTPEDRRNGELETVIKAWVAAVTKTKKGAKERSASGKQKQRKRQKNPKGESQQQHRPVTAAPHLRTDDPLFDTSHGRVRPATSPTRLRRLSNTHSNARGGALPRPAHRARPATSPTRTRRRGSHRGFNRGGSTAGRRPSTASSASGGMRERLGIQNTSMREVVPARVNALLRLAAAAGQHPELSQQNRASRRRAQIRNGGTPNWVKVYEEDIDRARKRGAARRAKARRDVARANARGLRGVKGSVQRSSWAGVHVRRRSGDVISMP